MIKIDSPIANLVQVLEKIKLDAEKYKDRLYKNEAATRATLIDPIIQKLGWDTRNPEMVEFERTSGSTRIDYALYNSKQEVKIIVEAKSLETNLNDSNITYKVFAYAFKYRNQNIFLTNGLEWYCFSDVKPDDTTPTKLDLQNDDLFEIAKFMISNMDAALYWLPSKEKLSPPDPIKSGPPRVENWQPVSELTNDIEGEAPPKYLKLPDGTIKNIKYWRDILYHTCIYVLSNSNNLPLPLVDQSGKKINLIDTNIPPKINNARRIETYQGEKVVIFLGYASFRCIKNTLYILGFLPTGKENKVYVKF